jgi:rhodanese-related sulfurtransferase
MTIREISAKQAAEVLAANETAVYLDVRTVREFDQGHAAGAYNVPVLVMEPGQPAEQNADFLETVTRHFAKQLKLIVGCQSGVRSMTACKLLQEKGYGDLTNVAGGFGGTRDGSTIGWRDAGLPVDADAQPGRSYAELKD